MFSFICFDGQLDVVGVRRHEDWQGSSS